MTFYNFCVVKCAKSLKKLNVLFEKRRLKIIKKTLHFVFRNLWKSKLSWPLWDIVLKYLSSCFCVPEILEFSPVDGLKICQPVFVNQFDISSFSQITDSILRKLTVWKNNNNFAFFKFHSNVLNQLTFRKIRLQLWIPKQLILYAC